MGALTDAQRARANASKARAKAIRAAKTADAAKGGKQRSMLSFFTPVSGGKDAAACKVPASRARHAEDTTPSSVALPAAKTHARSSTGASGLSPPLRGSDDGSEQDTKKRLLFRSPDAGASKPAHGAGSKCDGDTRQSRADRGPAGGGNLCPPTRPAAAKAPPVAALKESLPDRETLPRGTSAQAHRNGRRRAASARINYADADSASDSDANDAAAVADTSQHRRKRLRRRVDSDDSDESDAYVPDAVDLKQELDDNTNDKMIESDKDDPESDLNADSVGDDSPVAKKKVRKAPSSKTSPTGSARAGALTAKFASLPSATKPAARGGMFPVKKATPPGAGETEERYSWLRTPLRDACGVAEGEPGYDPSTLLLPKKPMRTVHGRLKPLTEFETQYWRIKARFWDTVVFFKKGKFYELYEKDADIGHRELGLKLTDRVNMKMVGVPEKTFATWAGKLLGLGYKVAKVDERETMLAKEMRESKLNKAHKKLGTVPTKESKIIQRELTQVITQGTLSGDFLVGDMSTFILSIKESTDVPNRFGVCFADVGTAEINLSSFDDDAALTQLETLLVQVKPREVICAKGQVSPTVMRLLRMHAPSTNINRLQPDDEFWDAAKTVDELTREGYFADREAPGSASGSGPAHAEWPPVLRTAVDALHARGAPREGDTGALHEEALSALGGTISYFRTLLIDTQVISQGHFRYYNPLKHGGTLMLDGQTLQNLEVLENTVDAGPAGTVFELLCHCRTGFGRRLFRKWLCHPLRAVDDINRRLCTVDAIHDNPELQEVLLELLTKVPDLERSISQIHVGSCKVPLFLQTLDAFGTVWTLVTQRIAPLVEQLATVGAGLPPGLQELLSVGGGIADLGDELAYFDGAFDWDHAREHGEILPSPGTIAEYDDNSAEIIAMESTLNTYIRGYRREFGLGKLQYYHPGVSKEQYQIPIPLSSVKKVPKTWVLISSTKGEKRYWSPEVQEMQEPLAMLKETKKQLLRDSLKTMLRTFDTSLAKWLGVVDTLARVDCLLSLSVAREVMGEPMCRPDFKASGPPMLSVEGLRHPCLVNTGAVQDYIPNDTMLGGSTVDAAGQTQPTPSAILLTGPNMGGKSTLLRQTCIAVIMAQLGAYVPAETFALTPVDRIFTRIGANDNIIAGRSTFMVELKETATILNQATADSLVILDELGRGTSTFDGTAIAHATLDHLVNHTQCRTLFATHYHSLTDDFRAHPAVSLQHMSCFVQPGGRDVTFLYKLASGVCSKSYGLNVATMAGLPTDLVAQAETKACELAEATSKRLGTRRSELSDTCRTLIDALDAADTQCSADDLARINALLLQLA
eukprot:m.877656 g.877656  ORF g.877656 m.877656 type:complete len:1327 (+) comp23582_c0_seq5:181-4161(+)